MRIKLAVFAFALALAVGCSEDATSPNLPPSAPSQPTPADASINQPRDVTLAWKGANDAEGGAVTYDVSIGFGGIMRKVASGVKGTSYIPTETLEYGRPYSWRVTAVDAAGSRTQGPLWKFTVIPCPTTAGNICTWAGTGYALWDGGGNELMESSFYWPMDVEFTPTQGTFIVDYNNHRIRRLQPDNTLVTVIGTNIIGDGPEDKSDLTLPGAPGTECRLNHPTRLVELRHGPHAGKILLTSWHNHKLRRWDPATGLIFVTIGRGASYDGDGQDATAAGRLNQPQHAIEASDGSIYILDQRNQVIRRIDLSNIITTVAGKHVLDVNNEAEGGYNGDGLAPMETRFNFESGGNPQPSGAIVLDDQGNLYVADVLNHIVRKIDWNANTVTIVAGQAQSPGYAGDGGDATSALMNGPMDMGWGPDGRLYVAEKYNHVVRAIDLGTGAIATVAGTGVPGFSGDGGPATQAQLDSPHGIAFDAAGDLYIVDTNNHRFRKVFMP